MSKGRELAGKRFGRLVALEIVPNYRDTGVYWRCQCDCGDRTIVYSSSLIYGYTKSCGCLQREYIYAFVERANKVATISSDIMEKTDHDLYFILSNIWNDLILSSNRSLNSNSVFSPYPIPICYEWKYDFISFCDC